MALTVNDLYVFTQKLIRKNQSGSLTSTEFNTFWNDAQRAYMGDLLGRFQLRSNGKLGMNTGLILNETILTLSLIHISEPTRPCGTSRMPSSA